MPKTSRGGVSTSCRASAPIDRCCAWRRSSRPISRKDHSSANAAPIVFIRLLRPPDIRGRDAIFKSSVNGDETMPRHRIPRHVRRSLPALILLALGICSLGLGWAANSAPIPLAKGTLLAAGAHIVDPRFRESLILITDHDRNGSAGLIVNHPTHVAVTHALTGLKELRDLDEDHLYVGGPIASDEVFILMRSDTPRPVNHVFANIYFGRGVEALRQLAPHVNPHETLRVYIGYVGWTAGQLEEELERGDWIVAPPDGETIFNASPQILWQRFIRNWSGQWLLGGQPHSIVPCRGAGAAAAGGRPAYLRMHRHPFRGLRLDRREGKYRGGLAGR